MESLSFEKAKETFSAKTVELSCRELFKLREEFVSIFSIEKIPPKGESFSNFIATFAMSVGFDTYFNLQH